MADPEGTVADLCTGSSTLLLDNDTAVPPAGAVWLKVIVHVVTAADARLVGVQVSDETDRETVRLRAAVWETPFSVAVSVTFWLPVTVPAVVLNVVVVERAGTVTVELGTGSSTLLLESETTVPPAGAA